MPAIAISNNDIAVVTWMLNHNLGAHSSARLFGEDTLSDEPKNIMTQEVTPTRDITPQEAIKRLEQNIGSREEMLAYSLTMLSTSGQPTDVTFYKRKPLLDVKVSTKIGAARFYGLENYLPRLLKRIEFSNGAVAGLGEIWTINPMPKGGFSAEELACVDLSKGEERHGPRGETLRTMIRNTYHCNSRNETDYFLRRWIAS